MKGTLGSAVGDVVETLHIAHICSVLAVLVLTGRLAAARTEWPSPRCTDLRGIPRDRVQVDTNV